MATFDNETLGMIRVFESTTRTPVKDFLVFRNKQTFLVDEGNALKALGKNLENLKKLENLLNKQVRIVEFSKDRQQFIVNMLRPLKVLEINSEGDVVTVKGADEKTRGLMIGARAQNLRALEEIVKKFFTVEEIKVV